MVGKGDRNGGGEGEEEKGRRSHPAVPQLSPFS